MGRFTKPIPPLRLCVSVPTWGITLCVCVSVWKMPVRRELTDINPVSIFLFIHIELCCILGQILLLVVCRCPKLFLWCPFAYAYVLPALRPSFLRLQSPLPPFDFLSRLPLPISPPLPVFFTNLVSSCILSLPPFISFSFNLLGLSLSSPHMVFSLSVSPFLPIFFYMVVQEIILSQQEIDQIVPNTVFPFSPHVTGFGLPGMQW